MFVCSHRSTKQQKTVQQRSVCRTRFQANKTKLLLLLKANQKPKILIKSRLLSNSILQARKDNGLLHRLLVKTYPDNLNLCRQKKRLSLKHRHSNPNPQLTRLSQQLSKVTHSKLSQRTKLSQQPSKEIHSKPKQQPLSQTPKRRTKRKSKASLSLNRQQTPSPNVPHPILQPNQSNRRKSLKHLNSQVLVR